MQWTLSGKVDAKVISATMRALSHCGVPAILCLRGDAFELEGAGTKGDYASQSSSLVTFVGCARIDAGALALVRDHSALTMCCTTTTTYCRPTASRADAVEVSRLRCTKLTPP